MFSLSGSMYIAGIDEAGRGPVIGPMVMALVAVDEKMDFELRTLGIDDSKIISDIKRRELAEVIKREGLVETIIVSNKEIDQALLDPLRNLNILEAEMAGELINRMSKRLGKKLKHVVLDCPSVNPRAYLELMKMYADNSVKLIAEHKADAKYPTVSAASIIAKVMRDDEILKLKIKHGVDFGSGYPGDVRTAEFVHKHYKDYDFFRTTWETYKRVAFASKQQTLGGFGADLSPAVEKKKQEILKLGFNRVETKGVAEILRVKGPDVTITLYSNGRVLVQGKGKDRYDL